MPSYLCAPFVVVAEFGRRSCKTAAKVSFVSNTKSSGSRLSSEPQARLHLENDDNW